MQRFKKMFLMVVLLFGALLFAMPSGAATFKAEVHVEADNAGVVTITKGDEIVRLIQFCPDEWVDGCDSNIIIEKKGNSFALNKDGLANHQNAFNFIDASGKWLLIPDRMRVTTGNNVKIETIESKGHKKSSFVYTDAAVKK